MHKHVVALILLCCVATCSFAQGNSIWARRNPYHANLIEDSRARRIGDLLTIAIRETTLFDGKEDRKMNKTIRRAFGFLFKGAFTFGQHQIPEFSGQFDHSGNSDKRLDAKADYKSDRRFIDRMTVQVIDVLPNSNLVIEGYRERIVGYEKRMLRITGVVRPIDIGGDNVVESQYIGNFAVSYIGDGPATRYTNHGYLGRFFNRIGGF